MIENKFQKILSKTIANIILIVVALSCLIPFVIIISASFTSEGEIIKHGYGMFPRGFTLDAYKMVMHSSGELLDAYAVTIYTTVVGSLLSVLMTIMAAYPLSRKDYKWQRIFNFYFYFTMLFSGGAVPSYILISNYLNLKNNILVLILPLMFNVWNTFLLRTYFQQIPSAMWEAAEIDGAGQFKILFQIIVPMSVTGVATILLFVMLAYWNEWYLCLMYMSNEKVITLQFYLSRVLSEIEDTVNNRSGTIAMNMDVSNLPNETARMAMCVLAAGPMMFVFMFFQKYFTKGLNVGSVKG
ncbi:MAG: carbohydrate ABC transporter permease [Clostridia bacterium]|nr:carbohydrate ABC transporter permease [Clostridia bacterium]